MTTATTTHHRNSTTQPNAVFGLYALPSCRGLDGSTFAVHRRTTGLGLPGGFVLAGETPTDALIRKLKAELGDVEPVIGPQIYESEVDGYLVRTYTVDLGNPDKVRDWATADELIEAQARKPIAHYNLSVLLAAGFPLDALGETAWISALGSGTLQYSVGAAHSRELYLHERAAFELGLQWDTVVPSRITRGKALAMGDCPQWTESLWFSRHTRFAGHPSIRLQVLAPEWIAITEDNERWDGLALLATPTGLPWWPPGRLAVAKLATWNTATGKWAS